MRETQDYPGLYVADGRVGGSITDGQSRLPLWAYMATLVAEGWPVVADCWPPHEMTTEKMGQFLYHLMEQRGEFARLVCVLADVERRAGSRGYSATQRKRLRKQLQRCIDELDGGDA